MKILSSKPKKSLGQHWLADEEALSYITEFSGVGEHDTVLEIGPGEGALTKHLVKKAGRVVAVELDDKLAVALPARVQSANLKVIYQDILKFDFRQMPKNYKVAANIPYYLTGHLLRLLIASPNPPYSMTLLLQKEVAERIAAQPGDMSILSVAIQLKYLPELGKIIKAEMFVPPPKVDSRVLSLKRHAPAPYPNLDEGVFFRVVKAGFSSPRKKLRSNLSGGLGISKQLADQLLDAAEINGNLRAEALSLAQWHELFVQYRAKADLGSLL